MNNRIIVYVLIFTIALLLSFITCLYAQQDNELRLKSASEFVLEDQFQKKQLSEVEWKIKRECCWIGEVRLLKNMILMMV